MRLQKRTKKVLLVATLSMVVATAVPLSSLPSQNVVSTEAKAKKLTKTQVKDIVLKDAGLTSSQVKFTKVHFDYDDGVAVYEVEFFKGDMEYDYELDAKTGKILEKSIEKDGDRKVIKKKSNYIGKTKAKEIALKHAGLKTSEVKRLKVEFDKDNGVAVYDVEFEKKNKKTTTEYTYEIDAKTGKILDWESEIDD